MKVEFQAKAYISNFISIESVVNGQTLPMITSDGAYYDGEGYPQIGTATVTIELFSDDEITAKKLKALREQLHTVRAENQRRENAILDQISKLEALTCEVDA